MFDRVLVLLDGSDTAAVVLQHVPWFASSAAAEKVTLLNVLDAPSEPAVLESYLQERVQEVKRRWTPDLGPPPDIERSAISAEAGDVAGTITAFAAAQEAEVVMLASRGWSGADWWTTGSVAQQVIRSSPVPVFVVRPGSGRHPAPGRLGSVLVPLDGSDLAERALPYAAALARTAKAIVTLLLVEEGAERGMVDGEYLAAMAGREATAGIDTVTIVRNGPAGQQIAETAKQQGVHLVAMSSHGRAGPGRGALGGVTDRVLHGCHVPVLIV